MDKTQFMKRIFKEQSYILKSGYGYRWHPILHVNKFHDGEDYGTNGVKCPLYSPVFGTIIKAAYSTVMGHYVIIKTPFGTIRMQHMNARKAVLNQEVCPGTLIGYCGTTGMSTGVHLHIAFKTLAGTSMNPDTFIGNYSETKKYPGPWPVYTVREGHGTIEDVKRVQAFLCWYGPNTTIDGDPGVNTGNTIENFQRLNGLVPDRAFGPASKRVAQSILRW